MRMPTQFPLQRFDFSEDSPHEGNRVKPFLRPAAVRRPAERVDLGPHESLVGGNHFEPRWLHDHGRVSADILKESARAFAFELFIRDTGENHIAL